MDEKINRFVQRETNVCVFVCVLKKRQKDRERQRQTDRQTQREMENEYDIRCIRLWRIKINVKR